MSSNPLHKNRKERNELISHPELEDSVIPLKGNVAVVVYLEWEDEQHAGKISCSVDGAKVENGSEDCRDFSSQDKLYLPKDRYPGYPYIVGDIPSTADSIALIMNLERGALFAHTVTVKEEVHQQQEVDMKESSIWESIPHLVETRYKFLGPSFISTI